MWALFWSMVVSTLKSFFGVSSDRKLGREETISEVQSKVLEKINEANKVDAINRQLDIDTIKLRTRQWQRPD